VSLSPTLNKNNKVKQYIRKKTHKPIVLWFWVKDSVIPLYMFGLFLLIVKSPRLYFYFYVKHIIDSCKLHVQISELEQLDLTSCTREHGSLHIPGLCFSKNVDYCQFLSDAVLPFPLHPLLPKLETLEVRNCDYVKTMFDVKFTTQDTLITFPLKKWFY